MGIHKKRRLWLFITLLLAVSILFTGCLDFGEDEETTSPTDEQLARCRAEMYLNPQVGLIPLGYKLLGSGIDDAIWFKFKTHASDLQEIFDSQVVDTSTFQEGFVLFDNMEELEWWDTNGKEFLGGQVELPNVRYMTVGAEKIDDGYVVYIMWHET